MSGQPLAMKQTSNVPVEQKPIVDWIMYGLRACLMLCLMMGTIGLTGCTKRAQNTADREQRALETLKGRPWYDSEKLAYRPPKTSSDFDSPVRINGWEAAPKPPKATKPPGTPWNWNWGFFDGGLSVFVWLVLGAALLALALVLAGSSMKFWGSQKQLSKLSKSIAIDPARVVDLPFETRQEMHDPLEAARRMAEAGDFDGAVLFLYGYMLLALDRAGQIVLHRGKTNRMYLFELSGQRTLRDLLYPAMLAFEDVFFGRHPTDRQRFTELWSNLDRFHKELEPVMRGRELAAAEVATT